jgi:hypothetical protein
VISPYSEVYRSLDLRAHDIRIDDRAAVNRADNPADANIAILRHLDFGNLGHIGSEDGLD